MIGVHCLGAGLSYLAQLVDGRALVDVRQLELFLDRKGTALEVWKNGLRVAHIRN